MSDAPLILGVSGLRGIVGESLTPEVAVRYAGAFGGWLRERVDGLPRVLICRDGRSGGGVFLDAVSAGLRGVGCDVWDCDVLTTPSAGVVASERDCHAAVIVTASHNPEEWNGLKCLVSEGGAFSAPDADAAAEIVSRFQSGVIQYADSDDIAERTLDDLSTCVFHAGAVSEAAARIGLGVRERAETVSGMRVVADSVNASGTRVTEKLMGLLFANLVQLHGSDSGIFPHTPEPTKENLSGEGGLCDAVPGLKADVGFAQDPDADRLAIVDEKGSYIGEEYTLVLCAVALMEAREAQGLKSLGIDGRRPVFVVNLSTSRMIDDVAAHYGAEVVRTPVGEANVVERMKQLKMAGRDVVMGGEGNGGVIWPEVTYVRDSLSAMALTLALMARSGKKVSELVAMIDAMGPGKKGGGGYCIIKRKAPLASKADAVPVVEHLAKVYRGEGGGGGGGAVVDIQDGVRIDWPARGVWAHVRASNTEPIMRVIVEAPTEAEAHDTARSVEARIAEI